jgi:hypothetical protein
MVLQVGVEEDAVAFADKTLGLNPQGFGIHQ